MAAAFGLRSSQLPRRPLKTALHSPGFNCAGQPASSHTTYSQGPSQTASSWRNFSSSSGRGPRFSQRLGAALRGSKITWYHIPVGVGVGFLGLVQFYKVTAREEKKRRQDQDDSGVDQPKRRPKIRPEGPCLDEVAEPDLHVYPNLASFFYRTLKSGVRPLDPDTQALVSPSDGKVLQYGQIQGGDIEQVKGMTYSIDALLGKNTPVASVFSSSSSTSDESRGDLLQSGDEPVKQDEEFAKVNGITYTLPDLLSGQTHDAKPQPMADAATEVSQGAVSEVRAELALGEKPWYDILSGDKNTSLYYAVIYLAPGDYHRFHSPTNWVVERRRHFAGELYSVSPYLQRTLPGLFTLNERVVLLGRWRYGFFSYVPVGATNVGSIKINFDRELRTNSLLTDTAADRAAEEAAQRGEPYLGFAEATYESASPVLRGHALRRGDEMGGFQLGSTIVLVFEAPAEKREEGRPVAGWQWAIEKGQKIKMGQALGRVVED
ncbi:phosphatidylserine decarboxylase proenzyme 1 precursor [Moelleriella libera RCEF 2490]|uniref:Phosphatidylserine decarboxylase proenzyme 1, mitochondrial n=1 Tax=Moelleriella libera RCEF 2490 TaxID=1081109 RepID=A0A168F1Y9_9HYPO|nr:phosphatidylserine decarboxylase proenzyme 1 precursor [Moelleriella libera RCEF 2490]